MPAHSYNCALCIQLLYMIFHKGKGDCVKVYGFLQLNVPNIKSVYRRKITCNFFYITSQTGRTILMFPSYPVCGGILIAKGLSLIHISEPTRRTPISYA